MDFESHEKFTQLKNAVDLYFNQKRQEIKPKGIFDLKNKATLGRLSTIQKQVEKELYDALEKGTSAEDIIKRYENEISEILGQRDFVDEIIKNLGGN